MHISSIMQKCKVKYWRHRWGPLVASGPPLLSRGTHAIPMQHSLTICLMKFFLLDCYFAFALRHIALCIRCNNILLVCTVSMGLVYFLWSLSYFLVIQQQWSWNLLMLDNLPSKIMIVLTSEIRMV